MVIKQEIVICPKCKGLGSENERSGAYDTITVNCNYCNGNRVVIEKVTHENMPTAST